MPQAVGAIASIGGAILGKKASGDAADAQRNAAVQDMALQRETRDLIRADLAPYRRGGNAAQRALDFELGLRDRPTFGGSTPQVESFFQGGSGGGAGGFVGAGMNFLGGMAGVGAPQSGGGRGVEMFRVGDKTFSTRPEAEAYAKANTKPGIEYGGYTKTPGYDFRLQQGQDSMEAGAAARGGLYSGAAMQDLMKFGQDYGSNEYGNYLSRLGARADTGMNAATMNAQSAQQSAGNMSNALGNAGNAAAAGAIGGANALTGGLQNLAGLWNYQRNLNPQMASPAIVNSANAEINRVLGR